MTTFVLPSAPAEMTGPVKAWFEPVAIPTYLPAAGDRNPMFLDSRVNQGASGNVYPMAFVDQITSEPVMHTWQAVHLENEYVRVMILPEIGGRIHLAQDRTNAYDFIHRQDIIKPALVGLAGPSIPGGIEFNWPKHGRPATFIAVSVHIQEHADGARTVWCSHHDALTRMKGMHGVCLYPGRSYIEVKVRLFNRTPTRQTFQWCANASVRANEQYQVFSPSHVQYVADLAVPTSCLAQASRGDFMGGYDHSRHAGFVHVASHHIAPAKQFWTRGNHPWERGPIDHDGSYVGLMAGAYTDNQANSFLAPYETKTFSQFWFPIAKIGVPKKANVDAAVSLHIQGQAAQVGVAVTSAFPGASVTLEWRDLTLASWACDLSPAQPLTETVSLPDTGLENELTLRVRSSGGRELILYATGQPARATAEMPGSPADFGPPRKMQNPEELYLAGLHSAQNRDPIRSPEEYWNEALRRDLGDSRVNLELGRQQLERGEFVEAEESFRRAIQRLTKHNANPAEGEPFYLLGICLRYLGRDEQAYDELFKATWNYAWRAPALYALAELDVKAGRWEEAPQRLYEALRLNADNSSVRNLAVAVFRKFNRGPQAAALLGETFAQDPLDAWARHLAGDTVPGDNQVRLDVAFDYMRAGLYAPAIDLLTAADIFAKDGSVPMVHYTLAYAYENVGDDSKAEHERQQGRSAVTDRCMPYRLDELLVLEQALRADPSDARAFLYLGNWLYARQRHEQAVECWEIATRLEPALASAWRNLGLGRFNDRGDPERAVVAYDRAFQADPTDARVFYERDQLWKRTGVRAQQRLAELERHPELVKQRDDLAIELTVLYNLTGQPERAAAVLAGRRFQPSEGREGRALAQYVTTKLALGRRAVAQGEPSRALEHFSLALEALGEAKHQVTPHPEVQFWMGEAYTAAGNIDAAITHWQRAADDKALTEQTLYSALAMARLGERRESRTLLRQLWFYGRKIAREKRGVDDFAPSMLFFTDDLRRRSRVHGLFLQTQARIGLGQWKLAKRTLEQLLELQPNHEQALELLSEFPQLSP